MKRRTIGHGAFSIMLLLAVSLVTFALPALAQTTVSIDSVTVDVDGETTLPIVINNVDDPDGVGTADIKLSFNSDVVHVTASTAGDFDSITPNLGQNESGAASYVRFLAYQVANPGLTSGAIVTTVTLKAVGTAGQESPLDITITTLADNTPAGNEIPADDADGTFAVGAAVLPGDLNGDNQITTADTVIALQIAASGGWNPTADVNNDKQVTSLDALMILQAAVGKIDL